MHNVRMPAMWRIINDNVNFIDKAVLDIGCGYGDFILLAGKAGTSDVTGWEIDKVSLEEADLKARNHTHIHVLNFDIAHWKPTKIQYDIIACLSVLPYVPVLPTLRKIRTATSLAIIECQYNGDGPGLSYIRDDADMFKLLEKTGFYGIPVGSTKVEHSGKERTIWICS